MKDRFYLTSSHGNLGSNVVWHRKEECGYSSNIEEAHVYTLKEAQEYWEESTGECQPLSADHVDALSTWKVDCQNIPKQTTFQDSPALYVAYKKGQWDGNYVYWMTMIFGPSTNFDKAYSMDEDLARSFLKCEEESRDFIVIPKHLATFGKKRTFEARLINARTMIQGAGLKVPESVKRLKRRKENPKLRWNCPRCGKLVWQYNPYDFEVCPYCRLIGDLV